MSGPHLERFAALAAIASCLLAEAAVLSLGLDDLDEGYFAEQATRVLAGQVPYRDFESLYTPGVTYLHAAVFGVAGEPSVIGMRWVALIGRASVVFLMYALARPIVRPLWAALAPVFLLAGLDAAPDRWNTHPGWPSTVTGLLAISAVSQWATKRRTPWLVACGAAAGLTFFFKQNTGVFISIAIGVFVLLHERDRLARSIPSVTAGFAAVTLPWLLPLVWALGADLRPLAHFIGAIDTSALFYPPEPLNLLALASLAAAVALVIQARHEKDAWRPRWYLIGGCALLLTQYPRMDTMHLAWSAPVVLLLGAAFLARLPAVVSALGVGIVAVCALPMLTARIQPFVGQTLVTIDTVPVAKGLLVPQKTRLNFEGLVHDVRSRTGPGEAIFVYPTSPLLYLAAERPNPTRFAHLYPGAANPAQVELLLRHLEERSVRTVVVDDFWLPIWGPPRENQPIEDYLATHFGDVARFGAYRVLERVSP